MEKTNTLNDLRKSYTYMINNPNFKKSEIKRIKTCQPCMKQDKINLLTENIYGGIKFHAKDDFSNVMEEDSKVLLDNGGLKVKERTVKKLSGIIKQYTKEENGNLIDRSTQDFKEGVSKIKEIREIEEENKNLLIKNRDIFSKIPHEKLQLLESLMYEYYSDISDNTLINYDNYVVNNLTIISFLETIIPNEMKSIKLSSDEIDAIREFDRTKKTLFLDLDETLIHSDTQGMFNSHDEIVTMEIDGAKVEFGLIIRPYCNEFLEFASKNFNVILFTAGHKFYADAVISKIDPENKYFNLKLYRQHCIEFKNIFIKDLTILPTFGLKDLILVDNCLFSFTRNLTNGILISSYYNDIDDVELLNLIGFLENNIVDSFDTRKIIEGIFKFNSTKGFLCEQLKAEKIIN